MIDLQNELERLFTFERNISPAYQMMKSHPGNQVSSQFFNVVLKDKSGNFPEVFMKAPVLTSGRNGYTIMVYAYDRVIRTTGPGLSPVSAPTSFSKIPDCEYAYYGMMLNVLAFLHGGKIDKLVIIDLYNGQTEKVVMFKPYFAIDFIKWAISQHKPESELVIPVAKEFQSNLFS